MAILPRLQLFEFNDAPWAPAALREVIVDSLSHTLERGRMLDGLVAPFAEFLAASGCDHILDLCAGAGGPARVLLRALAAQGLRPKLTLTDLHPRLDAWRALARELPQQVDFCSTPVDATAVPPELAAGRARVVINALHHFPPAVVSALLIDAAEAGAPIFISEAFARQPLAFAAFGPAGLPALYGAPLRGGDRLAKALLVWATPIALATGVWDGLVSTLRVYDEEELRALAAPAGAGHVWRFGTYPAPYRGRGTWFSGISGAGRAG